MLRASLAGGLWAFLLSTSGLSFASVMTEIPDSRDWAPKIAAVTPQVVNAPQPTVAAPSTSTQNAPVVATAIPVPTVPQIEAGPSVASEPPLVMTAFEADLSSVAVGAAPAWQLTTLGDADLDRAATSDIGQPDVPPAPLLVTMPAAAPATPVVTAAAVTQAPNPAPVATTIVPVQSDGNGGLVQRRLPQILPDPPAEAETAEDGAEDAATETDDENDNQIGTQGGNILDRDAPEAEGADDSTDAEQAIADAPPATALQAFAAEFENPNNLPLIGVVLVDEGTLEDGPQRTFDSGFAATIAIDALREDVTLWSEAYRAAGMEVAMQVPLPMGVQPSDVEVAFAAAMDLLPEAAFLFSSGEGVLRNDRKAAQQVMSILATDGHGFVTLERGLGSLVREAERASVPVARIWRDIDGNGESVSTMSRTLDRAAFTARQSGNVVIVGRLQPLTLEVLSVWNLNAEREGVLLAPVSALLIPPSVSDDAQSDAAPTDEGAQTEGTGSSLPTITE